MTCPCRELEELRAHKAAAEKKLRAAEKLLRAKEHDLIVLGRRCETLMVMLKRYIDIGEEKK